MTAAIPFTPAVLLAVFAAANAITRGAALRLVGRLIKPIIERKSA